MNMRNQRLVTATLFLSLIIPPLASACVLPVFRYALERWTPDVYDVMVFHKGEFTEDQKKLLREIGSCAVQAPDSFYSYSEARKTPANFVLHVISVEDSMQHWQDYVWKQQTAYELPWLVVRYPAGSRVDGQLWASRLEDFPVKRFVDSPIRSEIARRILDGETSVFVLVESGDKGKDKAAAKSLKAALKVMNTRIKLPPIPPEELPGWYDETAGPRLRIAFSVVHLSRSDPAELFLVRMLLNSSKDLEGQEIPIAFPVMGQGRALYALIGDDIKEETIEGACRFLSGPCSCVIKEENPGFDLLMAVDWASRVRSTYAVDEPLPPLTGFLDMVEKADTTKPAQKAKAAAKSTPAPDTKNESAGRNNSAPAAGSQSTAKAVEEVKQEPETRDAPPPPDNGGPIIIIDRSRSSSGPEAYQRALDEADDPGQSKGTFTRNLIYVAAAVFVLVLLAAGLLLRPKNK